MKNMLIEIAIISNLLISFYLVLDSIFGGINQLIDWLVILIVSISGFFLLPIITDLRLFLSGLFHEMEKDK